MTCVPLETRATTYRQNQKRVKDSFFSNIIFISRLLIFKLEWLFSPSVRCMIFIVTMTTTLSINNILFELKTAWVFLLFFSCESGFCSVALTNAVKWNESNIGIFFFFLLLLNRNHSVGPLALTSIQMTFAPRQPMSTFAFHMFVTCFNSCDEAGNMRVETPL